MKSRKLRPYNKQFFTPSSTSSQNWTRAQCRILYITLRQGDKHGHFLYKKQDTKLSPSQIPEYIKRWKHTWAIPLYKIRKQRPDKKCAWPRYVWCQIMKDAMYRSKNHLLYKLRILRPSWTEIYDSSGISKQITFQKHKAIARKLMKQQHLLFWN